MDGNHLLKGIQTLKLSNHQHFNSEVKGKHQTIRPLPDHGYTHCHCATYSVSMILQRGQFAFAGWRVHCAIWEFPVGNDKQYSQFQLPTHGAASNKPWGCDLKHDPENFTGNEEGTEVAWPIVLSSRVIDTALLYPILYTLHTLFRSTQWRSSDECREWERDFSGSDRE